ncbi:hypothetical protein QBC34DRAFT_470643 [Podospora aff. communis PSN243]|uniref:NACHT domain-containing protein n=1 Tax=Podospora aff. communis PSN243 TaxID=3040156 RepID=A0AAV9GDV2_9PEZI|nr:hypothetical protein QBC34DRAFT_470643 [Podospora aff. communis PSN243]
MAHEKTFDWVFRPGEGQNWSDFPAWLRSPNQLYWITGKAGSGKSTLMKFISQPAETTGVVRYAIKVVSPARWAASCLFDGSEQLKPFSDRDLEEMLVQTVRHLEQLGCALCLFVDGLDEFEGDPKALVCVLRRIIQDTPTKLCASSRPWQYFQDSFGSGPSLRVKDLTLRDIENFITDRFLDDDNFARVRTLELKCAAQLVSEVGNKSSGVFLWVHLVVTSLLDGMREGDSISDLQRRLEELPPDLEHLYDKILGDAPNPLHLKKMAQYMKLVDSALEPLPLLLLSFADEDDPDFAIKSKLIVDGQLDEKIVEARLAQMERRVKSRCKGLLEVTLGPRGSSVTHQVQYIQKTVKDYIHRPGTQVAFAAELRGTTFDSYLSLAAGSLAMYKMAWNQPKDLVYGLFYASRVGDAKIPQMIRILDELDAVCSIRPVPNGRRFPRSKEEIRSFVTDSLFASPRPLWIFSYQDPWCFLSLATQCGVVEYVRHRITAPYLDPAGYSPVYTSSIHSNSFLRSIMNTGERRSHTRKFKELWPLLYDAIHPLSPWPTCNSATVAMLLDKGAGPNFSMRYRLGYNDGAIRQRALTSLLREFADNFSISVDRKIMWEEIAQLMVKHGADFSRDLVMRAVSGVGEGWGVDWYVDEETESPLGDGLKKSLDNAKRGKGFQLGLHFKLSQIPKWSIFQSPSQGST